MNTALSLGGVAIAVAILWANFRPWWKGSRDPKALIPFLSGALLGCLSTICVGGLLGWGAAGIAGLASRAGNSAVAKTVGTGPQPVAHGSMGHLTPAGGVVVVLLLVGVVLLIRASGKTDKRRVYGGLFCGAVLGFLPGVAGALTFLPEAVNSIGAYGASTIGSAL